MRLRSPSGSSTTSQANIQEYQDNWLDYRVDVLSNPDQATLKRLALNHTPAILETAMGSLNKISRNKARMAKHTYVISNTAEGYSHATIGEQRAKQLIEAQRQYIEEKGQLIEVQGYLGVGPRARGVQYLYTLEGANIAGMQQVLSFPRDEVEEDTSAPFQPRFRVIYTPDFRPDIAGKQCILVDLVHGVTFVMGPDYFGESKKGALRMLCENAYQEGGLVLHAGAKEVLLADQRLTVAILGLSGTGKTTTTFSTQGEGVRPVQDDMVTLWPNGELSVTENGCFAKTFGLNAETEPVIHAGSTAPSAWLENAYQDSTGQVDFFKKPLSAAEVRTLESVLVATGADADRVEQYASGAVSSNEIMPGGEPLDGWDFVQWTGNGRSVMPLSSIENAADLHDLPAVRSMGILNRDEGTGSITPGIVRFTTPAQAAGYFMLGETTKTSAAGKERGRIRSPFTQPFFPLSHALQARRFASLLATAESIECWLMNTGYVGGDADSVAMGQGHKVKIRHSSAMLEFLFTGRIIWETDPDFGYDVVAVDDPRNQALLELVPLAILRPDRYYASLGQWDAYRLEVALRHKQRADFLTSHEVDPSIIEDVVPSLKKYTL